ncbi:MAG: response regulator [Chloroflexota bacterium]
MKRARILIVDDDDLNVEVMQAYLEMQGYDILTAHSGERALVQVADDAPDVILLDVRMGGISGYETCRRLKDDDTTKHIPVLMVTGFNNKSDIEQIVAAGADDLLFKPINAPVMMLRVKRMVYQKQLYDQLYG